MSLDIDEKTRLAADVIGLAVGCAGTATVWLINFDIWLRMSISLATLVVLIFTIIHQYRRWKVEK